MRAKLSNLLYRLLIGILITSIGGATSLLIYSYVYRRWELKQRKLIYEYQATKTPFSYKEQIINRNCVEYLVLVENDGDDLVEPTPVNIFFRDRDVKIVFFYPFRTIYKYKDRHLPPPLFVPPEPSYPYLPEDSFYSDPVQTFYKHPQVLEELEQMVEEGRNRKEILKELITRFDKEFESMAYQTYFENLPVEACELDICIGPMEHGDIGQLLLNVVVQNIDVFRDEPPFLRMVSKSPGIQLIKKKVSFLESLIIELEPYLGTILLFLGISIGLNFLLALSLRRAGREKRRKPRVKRRVK